jgi:hypothetical protein
LRLTLKTPKLMVCSDANIGWSRCKSSLYTHIPKIDISVYNHKLQINFEIRSGWTIFRQHTVVGLWNLAKYLVVTTMIWDIDLISSQHSMDHFSVVFVKTKIFYGPFNFCMGHLHRITNFTPKHSELSIFCFYKDYTQM